MDALIAIRGVQFTSNDFTQRLDSAVIELEQGLDRSTFSQHMDKEGYLAYR